MKTLSFTFKYVALCLIISLFGALTFHSFASAQSSSGTTTEPTREEVIAALNEALAEISNSIQNSPDVSAQERVELYLDLIEVSRAILSIQTINRTSTQPTDDEEVRPEGELSREDANLYKVAAQLDSETLEVELTYYYTEDLDEIMDGGVYVEYDTEQQSLQLNEPSATSNSFEERVEYATLQIIDEVVRETNVLRAEVADNVLVSSYNPIRDVRQPRENIDSYAQLLFEDFGTHSIIENVTVQSTNIGSSIVITTDQDERLVIRLAEIIPEGRGGRGEEPGVRAANPEDALYSFGYDFYSTSINQVIERERGEDPVTVPTITVSQTDIEYDDILDVLVGFFGEMPFSEGIDDVAEQTLQFLVHNPASLIYNEDTTTAVTHPETHAAQCISETDVLVMNAVLLQLIGSLRAQFIVSEDAIDYHVPFRSERTHSDARCSGVRTFF
jgi:hypothetical protein